MSVKAEVEKKDAFTAAIDFNIPSKQASQEYSKACRRLGQRVNIPGFRRGKAPRSVVEKTVGVDRIKQEAMDRILPTVFADIINEHELDIIAPPQIQEYEFDLEKGVQIKAQVELRPECTVPSFEKLNVEVPEFKTPEDAEEKEIQSILQRMVTLETIIDRPANKTDLVNIDFTGSVDGTPIKGGSAKNYRLDLGDNNFIEGFSEQVVGHSISDEFKIKVTFPKEYHDKELASKEAEFEIKLNEIKEKALPELTDELAKKVGPYETVAALKEDIHNLLKENAEKEMEFRKQRALIQAVVSQASVEVPPNMIEREAKLLMDEAKQQLKNQGHSWEQFLEVQGPDSVLQKMRGEADQRLRTSLVFGAIAKREGIQVTEEEFGAQVKSLAAMSKTEEKQVMRQLANNVNAAQSMNDQILSQKIVDHLSERTEFKLVPEEAEEAKSTTAKKAKKSKKATSGPSKEEAIVAEAIEGESFDVLEGE